MKKLTNWTLIFALGGILLTNAACAPAGNASSPALFAVTPTATNAGTPTPTIVWFPPTRTHTPFVTQEASATPQLFPGLGAETYRETFSDPAAWLNVKTDSGGGNAILLDRNRLTLAINASPGQLSSLHTQLLLTDFYAETLVRVNRCLDADSYGLLFRASAEFYAYRYTLNCMGQVRLERMRGGEVIPLQDWLPSGDVPISGAGEVRLGIWLSGAEMRFFLNDRLQFVVFDRYFPSGGLGVFAESKHPLGLNINFSDLVIYEVSYASPTPTATPTRTATSSRTPRP